MLLIAAFGMLVMVLSACMAADPARWGRTITAFAGHRHFHALEILSRALVGGLLVAVSAQAQHPTVIVGLGYLLMAVAVGLLLVGERRHRAFAARAATLTGVFRPAGLVGFVAGAYLVLAALWPRYGV